MPFYDLEDEMKPVNIWATNLNYGQHYGNKYTQKRAKGQQNKDVTNS